MRNFTWNRFPIKNLLIDSLLTPIVESTYLIQMKSLYCAAKRLRGNLTQYSPAVKHTLLHANVRLSIVEQINTQTIMKRLRDTCDNGDWIMHCIPMNISVRHQTYFVKTLMAWLETVYTCSVMRIFIQLNLLTTFKQHVLLTSLSVRQ